MVPEITNWLKQAEPDFDSGFSLFCRYSPNRSLISWIGRKRDAAMLAYELAKLNRIISAPVAAPVPRAVIAADTARPATPPPPQRPAQEQRPAITFKTIDDRRTRRSDLPPDLQVVYDGIAQEYKLRRGCHEKMKMATTDADRAAFRGKILECQDRITAGWKRIDAYLYEETTKAVAEKFNEKSCRAYISKALKEENLSQKKADGVRIRVKALLDHGCALSDETLQQLRRRNLA